MPIPIKPFRRILRPAVLRILALFALCASLSATLPAQTIDDGIMVARHGLLVGDLYSHDSWDQYWEGTLKRTNGNLGTVTTQTNIWVAAFGITDRLNLIANIPYVDTRTSQGVLHGMRGLQDITVAATYNFCRGGHQTRLAASHCPRLRRLPGDRLHARLPAALHWIRK